MLTVIESQPKYRLDAYFDDLTKINKSILSGELDYALCLINILERDGVSSRELIWNKIKILNSKKDLKSIEEQYQKLLSSDDSGFYTYSYAKFLFENEKFPQAALQFQNVIVNPNTSKPILFFSLRTIGHIYTLQKDFDSAEESFNKAYSLYTNCPTLSLNYGLLELRKSNYEKAKERFSESVSLDKENDVAWMGLAYCHQFFGENELHRACCLRALDSNKNNYLAKSELQKSLRIDA